MDNHFLYQSPFRSAEMRAQYAKHGFLIASPPDDTLAAKISEQIELYRPEISDTFYYSLLNLSPVQNIDLHNSLHKILSPIFDQIFYDYRTLSSSFLIKPAHTVEELKLHQDWNYTDETSYQPVTCWIPLCDVNERNGTLCFVPGSHLQYGIRSASYPTERRAFSEFNNICAVPAKAGQIICFHPAVIHGSYPNTSSHSRVISTSIVLPKKAPFQYYHKHDEDSCFVIPLKDDAFQLYLNEMATGNITSIWDAENQIVCHTDILNSQPNNLNK